MLHVINHRSFGWLAGITIFILFFLTFLCDLNKFLVNCNFKIMSQSFGRKLKKGCNSLEHNKVDFKEILEDNKILDAKLRKYRKHFKNSLTEI